MKQTRRDFLRTTLATAVIVTIPMVATANIASVAPFTVVPASAVNSNQHIIDALRYYDEFLAAAAKNAGRKAFSGKIDPVLDGKMYDAVDQLLEHIFKTFHYEKSEAVYKATQDILFGSDATEEKLRRVPPVIVEAAWPVALVKVILRDRAIPLNHRKMKSFKQFHTQYGWAILCDGWEEVCKQKG